MSSNPTAPTCRTADLLRSPRGYVTGTLEIRAPDGTLKGVLHLDGATDLTEPELREQLGLTSPET